LPVIDTEYFPSSTSTAITDFSWFTASAGSIPAGHCLPEVAAQKPNRTSGSIDPSIDVAILFLGQCVLVFHDLFNHVLAVTKYPTISEDWAAVWNCGGF